MDYLSTFFFILVSMKIRACLFWVCLLYAAKVIAQEERVYGIYKDSWELTVMSDSLERIPTDFFEVAPSFADSIQKIKHSIAPGIYVFDNRNDVLLLFRNARKKWIALRIPWNSLERVEEINIDRKGTAELVVTGFNSMYGTGGGSKCGGVLIFEVYPVPVLVFKAMNYTSEESFGEKLDEERLGEGAFFNEYRRQISVQEGSVTVGPPVQLPDGPYCPFTNLLEGIYHLKKGKFYKVQ